MVSVKIFILYIEIEAHAIKGLNKLIFIHFFLNFRNQLFVVDNLFTTKIRRGVQIAQ